MKWLIVVFALIIILFVGLVLIGLYISPQDQLQPADAIVAVSGGDTVARTEKAVELYEQGWAPVLIFSGAAADPLSESNAAAMARLAAREGVAPEAILLEQTSVNTEGNASGVGSIIESKKYKTIILVTSPYHQRRTALEFERRLGPDVEIINHSAVDQNWSKRGWWLNPYGWYLTVSELPKIIYSLSKS